MLGHELRNPLAAIRNAVQLQQVVELDHPRLKFTRESIERQTRQMARLLDDPLDVSRIVRRKPVELDELERALGRGGRELN